MADDEETEQAIEDMESEGSPLAAGATAEAAPLSPAPTAMVPAAAVATAPAATPAGRANGRKVREGIVHSVSMDKTAVVTVTERVRHPLYRKTLQRSKKLYAHDAENTCRVGDRVRIVETRPLSKLKRWRLLEVVERAR